MLETLGRAAAFERDRRSRIRRLRRLTPAAAARELEALLAFPWPRRRREDPPIPRDRFVTDARSR